ncbi:hypothetical protein E4T56_gene16174 [Termitomyces sp. T112]|nr:hypothetical protein E4T56_gene16174 [Termitomyces sp. T112]
MKENGMPWENVYNMDEKGIQMGGSQKGKAEKFIFDIMDKSQYCLKSDDLQLVTVIEVVCADGTHTIKPCFVFPGSSVFEEWHCIPDVLIATSENGWTDDYIAQEWFKKQFVPGAKARNTSAKPILLIYDGHGLHTILKMIEYAHENGVHLFCLPPHTTHHLQPLDMGVFSPLATAWSDCCSMILEESREGMELWYVVEEYMKVEEKVFKKETILQAWHKAGINPAQTDSFQDYSTSTQAKGVCQSTRLPHAPDASCEDFVPADAPDEESEDEESWE